MGRISVLFIQVKPTLARLTGILWANDPTGSPRCVCDNLSCDVAEDRAECNSVASVGGGSQG
jgi:hypothetical protein